MRSGAQSINFEWDFCSVQQASKMYINVHILVDDSSVELTTPFNQPTKPLNQDVLQGRRLHHRPLRCLRCGHPHSHREQLQHRSRSVLQQPECTWVSWLCSRIGSHRCCCPELIWSSWSPVQPRHCYWCWFRRKLVSLSRSIVRFYH